MSTDKRRRVHALLDGERDPASCTPDERATLDKYRRVLGRLEGRRTQAPAGMAARIMAALPEARQPVAIRWLAALVPRRRQWAVPALAGALAMLAIMMGVSRLALHPREPRVMVHFQIHAPGAERVELVGDFNNWTPGSIRLRGPDASGHWTADVEMSEGRYEYQFLVNGKTWVTDPDAVAHRPDGFGRENAVVDVFEERS